MSALAVMQHGIVARGQLQEIGLGRRAIEHRLEVGRLHIVHRGVYAVGYPRLSRHGAWLASVLACGPAAVLSHLSAAALWGIRSREPTLVEVSVPGRAGRRKGIHAHRVRIPSDEQTRVHAIPVTGSARTLLDLASVLSPHELGRALEQAEVLRLTDSLSLPQLIARYPRRPGTPALRAILDASASGASVTRSELEERFLKLIAEAGLPRPSVNTAIELSSGWIEVDCLWRGEGLIVELDGRASHATGPAFERDRARDRRLQAAGWRVVRITWRQLHDDARAIESDLRALLRGG